MTPVTTLTTMLLGAALAAAGSAAPLQAPSLAERVAAFELELATGVPDEALRARLRALEEACREAQALDPEAPQPKQLRAQLASLRLEVEQAGEAGEAAGASRTTPADVAMRVAVKAAVDAGDLNFLKRMGARAVPALRELARDPSDLLRRDGVQPALNSLERIDPAAAADVALELMASRSFAVKRETLRHVERIFARRELYGFDPAIGTEIRNAEWLRIPDLALEDPSIPRNEVMVQYRDLARHGSLPVEREDLLLEESTFPSSLAGEAVPRTLTLWRRMLRVESSRARLLALECLGQLGLFEETLFLADDPSKEVREAVAERLGVVTTKEVTLVGDRPVASWNPVPVAASPELLRAFTRLTCEESDDDIIGTAWRAIGARARQFGDVPFTADELRALLPRIPEVQHLPWFVGVIIGLPEEERFPTALAVIDELGRRDVTSEKGPPGVVNRLLDVESWGGNPREDFWRIAGALRGVEGLDRTIDQWVFRLAQNLIRDGKVEANGLGNWLCGSADAMATSLPWSVPVEGRKRFLADWFRGIDQHTRTRMILARGRLFTEAQLDEIRYPRVPDLNRKPLEGEPFLSSPGLLLGIVQSTEAVPETRLWAARTLDREGWERHADELVPAVADAVARVQDPVEADRALNEGILKSWKNAVIGELLGKRSVPDEFLLSLKATDAGNGLVDAVLRRYPVNSWSSLADGWLIPSIVPALLEAVERGQVEPLTIDALTNRKTREAVAYSLRPFRSPQNFQLLTEILKRTPVDERRYVVQSISQYLDDKAAGVLLEAAKDAHTPEQRDFIMEQLAKISAWRDAAAAWEKSVSAEARRAKALDGLVAILEDASATVEAKVAALKGLGVLQAAEELPRLIAALSSDEEALREAARAAIARIE